MRSAGILRASEATEGSAQDMAYDLRSAVEKISDDCCGQWAACAAGQIHGKTCRTEIKVA